MDIILHGKMDGINAAKQIRSMFNIPVVYLTAYSDGETLERAKLTEPYGYIIKPFKERELKINIVIALHKHKVEMQLEESRKFYEDVLEEIISGVWVADKNNVVHYANKGAMAIMGLSMQQILGLRIFKDFPEHFQSYYLKAKKKKKPLHYESVPITIHEGHLSYQSGWLIPQFKDGDFKGMVCIIESISKF